MNQKHTPLWNYVYIWVTVYPPPAFCDISKSHELRQFRVKGLGYMSLGFRLPSFPNFPNRAGPSGLGLFGKLGNWEVHTSTDFPISQIGAKPMFINTPCVHTQTWA